MAPQESEPKAVGTDTYDGSDHGQDPAGARLRITVVGPPPKLNLLRNGITIRGQLLTNSWSRSRKFPEFYHLIPARPLQAAGAASVARCGPKYSLRPMPSTSAACSRTSAAMAAGPREARFPGADRTIDLAGALRMADNWDNIHGKPTCREGRISTAAIPATTTATYPVASGGIHSLARYLGRADTDGDWPMFRPGLSGSAFCQRHFAECLLAGARLRPLRRRRLTT